jgi:hypothetical protein
MDIVIAYEMENSIVVSTVRLDITNDLLVN